MYRNHNNNPMKVCKLNDLKMNLAKAISIFYILVNKLTDL